MTIGAPTYCPICGARQWVHIEHRVTELHPSAVVTAMVHKIAASHKPECEKAYETRKVPA